MEHYNNISGRINWNNGGTPKTTYETREAVERWNRNVLEFPVPRNISIYIPKHEGRPRIEGATPEGSSGVTKPCTFDIREARSSRGVLIHVQM
jgi:hypothetical protein